MSITFYLYRLKIERSKEPELPGLLDGTSSSPSDIIRAAIEEKPSKEIRKGNIWHIGNIEQVGETGLFFAFGRITKSIVEKYNEEDGNFCDELEEQAPYTYVILDLKYQVCAVAHKSRIAPKVSQIAGNLAKLLNETKKAKDNNLNLVMAEISDPQEFLEYIRDAYIIRKFDVDFSPPNPWDVEHDFQEPMENLLRETGGQKGKTTIQGESLEKEPIQKLAAAAAATGNSASAQLQEEQDGNFITKRIGRNPASLPTNEIVIKDKKSSLLFEIIELYQRIKSARNYK